MKNFIEVINSDDERILININNIVKVEELNEVSKDKLKKIKEACDSTNILMNLFNDDFNNIAIESIDNSINSNTQIYLNNTWSNEKTSDTVYTNETYKDICKKIEEAQE